MGFYPFAPIIPSGAALATALAGQTIPATGLTSTGFAVVGTSNLNGKLVLQTANGGIQSTAIANANVLTPTNSNGTAAQLSDTSRDYMVYLTIGTAGTGLTVLIGPTSTPANTIYNASTATAGEAISFYLPNGWWWEWSATTATLASQLAIAV